MEQADSLTFESAAAELRSFGVIIRRLPGEYLVNFRNGGDQTERRAEDLGEAVQIGRAMALAGRAAEEGQTHARRPSTKTAKQYRARFIRRHNDAARRRAVRRMRERG